MKKLFFSSVLFAALLSCKKNQNADQIMEENTTENVENNNISAVGNMKVVTPIQLSDLLSVKKNDTIYVTNFFATWCGPCMKEIPHFVKKIKELKDKPVKFTFVNVDAKEDWATSVSDFGDEYDLKKNIVLFDASAITPDYFTKITKTWDGGSIPFTIIKKGDKEIETVGMMSKEDLTTKLNSFLKKR